jgi:carboxypeptidase PM20D1
MKASRGILSVFLLITNVEISAQTSTGAQYLNDEVVNLLSEYIRIPSVTGNEQRAGQFLSQVCKDKGLYVTIFDNEADSYNFAASIFPLSAGKPNIIFLNHIDVVPPGDSLEWTYPPFSGMIADGMIWGRGAIDLKGLAIMQLMSISEFWRHAELFDLPYNVTLLCVSQEEAPANMGALKVVSNHVSKLNPLVVFGEGGAGVSGLITSEPNTPVFCISVCDKQALWLSLRVTIPTNGHGSVPPQVYANQVMVKALSRIARKKQKIQINGANEWMFKSLGKLETGPRSFILKNIKLFKPVIASTLRKDPMVHSVVTNTVTLTGIENPSGAINQIAQTVTAHLDCRLLPGTDKDQFISQIKRSFKKTSVDVTIELESRSAKPSPLKNEFYQTFKSSIMEVYPHAKVVPIIFPAYTDNNHFRRIGVPVYGIKPIHLSPELLSAVHNVDERISIESLHHGIAVYRNFINRILVTSTLTAHKSGE